MSPAGLRPRGSGRGHEAAIELNHPSDALLKCEVNVIHLIALNR